MNTVVLGVGNTILADEGVGVRVVEALERDYRLPEGVVAIDGGTSSMEMLEDLSHLDFLLVIDAINDGKPPGTLIRLAGRNIVKKKKMHEVQDQIQKRIQKMAKQTKKQKK